jgi:hypothetical protein
MDIPESDWKLLRALKPAALERYCAPVLREVAALAADAGRSSHERYLALWELLRGRDEPLSSAFDGLRRSTAFFQLARMRRLGLVTDEEFGRFSPDTREAVALISGMPA